MDFSDIDIRAVILGILFNIVGSVVIGFIVGAVLAGFGMSADESRIFLNTGGMLAVNLTVGILLMIGSGYIAGHLADDGELLNGGVTSAICILLGVLFMGSYPLWYRVIVLLGAIPLGMLGGYIAQRRDQARRAKRDAF